MEFATSSFRRILGYWLGDRPLARISRSAEVRGEGEKHPDWSLDTSDGVGAVISRFFILSTFFCIARDFLNSASFSSSSPLIFLLALPKALLIRDLLDFLLLNCNLNLTVWVLVFPTKLICSSFSSALSNKLSTVALISLSAFCLLFCFSLKLLRFLLPFKRLCFLSFSLNQLFWRIIFSLGPVLYSKKFLCFSTFAFPGKLFEFPLFILPFS